MFDDFCPECGHLLPVAHERCSFCGMSLTDKYSIRKFVEIDDDTVSLTEFMRNDDRNVDGLSLS